MWYLLWGCAGSPEFTWNVLLRPAEAVGESCASSGDCVRYRIAIEGDTTPECALERVSVCVVEEGRGPSVDPPPADKMSREEHLRLLLANCMFAFPSQRLCTSDPTVDVVPNGSEVYVERVEVRRPLLGKPFANADVSLGSARVGARVDFGEEVRPGGMEYIGVGCALSMLARPTRDAAELSLPIRRAAVYHRLLPTTPVARKVDLSIQADVEPADRLVQWQASARALGLWTCSETPAAK